MSSDWNKQLVGLLSSYTPRIYKKGEIIIFQGEAPRHAHVIHSGIVKAYNLSLNGDEKPVAFYKEQDIFPAPWIFGHAPNAAYYYEVFSKTAEVYAVDKTELRDLLKLTPTLVYELLVREVELQHSDAMHINALQYSRASDKLIYTLHFLALNLGSKTELNELKLAVNITQQDLANLTGLTRETTAVELNKLKRLGIISYGPKEPYCLHLGKLSSLVNDQYITSLNSSS
jgi:CRP/FNR family cyclic AMP-dependent transcriptional regulator